LAVRRNSIVTCFQSLMKVLVMRTLTIHGEQMPDPTRASEMHKERSGGQRICYEYADTLLL